MKALSLSGLLAPIATDEFLREYAFKQPLFVKGTREKFSPLFTWDSLNRILSYTRHDPVRVHLERVDATDEELEFTRFARNVRGEHIPRIDVDRMYESLRHGSTLVVDAVNEVDPAVADLSEEMAAVLSATRATTVLFASFGHIPGFSVHWDSRDVYALQVEGHKYWRVYGPSRVAPLDRGDMRRPGSGVPGPLFWEGMLHKGDLLYVPRGWWHDVTAGDSPALHLNLGFSPVTALELLSWFTEIMEDSGIMRADIPRFGSAEELEEYECAIKDEISSRLAEVKLADFFASIRASDRGQVHVTLPAGVDGQEFLPEPGQLVRLTSRMTELGIHNGQCVLRGGGKEIAVPDTLAGIAEKLVESHAVSIAELAGTAPEFPDDVVRDFVAKLIRDGFVHTV
jgi:ribosomal protein L16 Arg81 hydroxylase